MASVLKYSFSLHTKIRVKDENLSVEYYTISLIRPETQFERQLSVENTTSNSNRSTSTEDEGLSSGDKPTPQTLKKLEDIKRFKPKDKFNFDSSGVCDLPINDEEFKAKLSKMLKIPNYPVNDGQRKKINSFFKKYIISDDMRKDLWRFKIGNRLKLNKQIYNNLKARLETEGIPKKAEKTITDDLDRTYPVCFDYEEGVQMYRNMKLILSLFEVGEV